MKDYFNYAIKSLKKNKVYTLINFGGLVLGFSVAIALTMIIIGMAGMDRFHENHETVYKLIHNDDSTSLNFSDATSVLLAPAVKDAFPGVTDYCRYFWANNKILGSPGNYVNENGFYVDEGWFSMFSFPLIYGDNENVLANLHNIVISQKLSEKLFGNVNPIGENINLYSYETDEPEVFTISGVFKDVPDYSSLRFEFVIPFDNFINQDNQSWTQFGTRSYVQITQDTDPVLLSGEITSLVRSLNQYMPDLKVFGMAPLHKSNHVIYTLSGAPSVGFFILIALGIVGLSILIISVINYVNLSVATSIKRAKEIGIKKIHGAGRKDLVLQFFTESFIVVTVAGIIALFLHIWFLNLFMDEQQQLSFHLNSTLLRVFTVLLFSTVLVTTWYPALHMSRFSPIEIFKANSGGHTKFSISRRLLVILQFFSAILLITTSVILSRQVDFIFNKSMGMDRYNTIYFTKNKQLDRHRDAFIQELSRQPGIESVTFSNQIPFEVGNSTSSINWEGKDPLSQDWFAVINAGENFLNTMRIKLYDGHDFSRETSGKIIVNRAAEELMQLEHLVGTTIFYAGNATEIAGVVENFNFRVMDHPDKPLFIRYDPDNSDKVFVRLSEINPSEGLKALEEVFSQFSPNFILDFTFLDKAFNDRFLMLRNMRRAMVIAGYLAVIIASFGLLGLTVHASERRVKELGVRKINGARIIDLIRLLSGQMFGSILIAAALAFPAAFLLNKAILQNFAERIEISMMHFALSLVILLGLTALIVGWQIISSARRNPVEALRYE